MFGIHLPGFLNPVKQLESAFSVVKGGLQNLEKLPELAVKEVKHNAVFTKDVLTLNFSGASKEAKAGVSDAMGTGAAIVANDVNTTKTVVKNAV